jgi:hypothetical protein
MVSIPASLSIAPADVKLTTGGKALLVVKVLDAKGREVPAEVTYQNPIDKVVAVANGTLTALTPGQGEIQATAGGVTGKIKVRVALPPAASIDFPKASLDIKLKATAPIGARALDEARRPIPGAALTYTSSNAKVAKVDASGLVRAVARGKARITVASGDAKAVVAVKVK